MLVMRESKGLVSDVVLTENGMASTLRNMGKGNGTREEWYTTRCPSKPTKTPPTAQNVCRRVRAVHYESKRTGMREL